MIRAAIALDNYKLPVFQKHLEEAKFTYEVTEGITPGTLTMFVETENVNILRMVVENANTEASKMKRPR